MIRVLFSIIFVVLILALGSCAQTAFRSHKAIGRSVALLLIGLIPPVIGNLVIISSTYKLGAAIGSEMPEALFFFEMNGQCIWANRPALELTGAGDGDFDLAAERLRELMGDCGEGCETWSGQQVVGSGEASRSYVVERHPVTDEGALFERADRALYESKHKGRCRFTFFETAEAT